MLRMNRTLGRASDADPDDVLGVKRALARLRYYDPPTGELHGHPDAELFESVEAFQRDRDLEIDGVLKPGGPTEAGLNAALDANGPMRRELGPLLAPASNLLGTQTAQAPGSSDGAPTAPIPPLPGEKPSSAGSLKVFMDAIHARESTTAGIGRGPGYLAENEQGYLGRYQLGPAARRDVGLVDAQGR